MTTFTVSLKDVREYGLRLDTRAYAFRAQCRKHGVVNALTLPGNPGPGAKQALLNCQSRNAAAKLLSDWLGYPCGSQQVEQELHRTWVALSREEYRRHELAVEHLDRVLNSSQTNQKSKDASKPLAGAV